MQDKTTIIEKQKGYLKTVARVYKQHYDHCKKGDNIIFDIDGTLIDGKNPMHSIIKMFQNFVSRGCNVYLITARMETCREETLKQLAKYNIVGFKDLIMFPQCNTYRSQSLIKIFKQSARNNIDDIKLSVGDNWDDIEYDYTNTRNDYQVFIGSEFIKLSN